MKKPTLEEFIQDMGQRPWSLYVTHPGFKPIYVRRGPCFVNNEYQHGIVTLANIEAKKPGSGCFRQLVEFLKSKNLSIYVECVQTDEFHDILIHMGFKKCNQAGGRNYFLDNGQARSQNEQV
jgi:hypothetical protein